METSVISHTAKGPINIALVKYWGKEDEEKIIPLNNSLSITLDMDKFYTITTADLDPSEQSEKNLLLLDGQEHKVSERIFKIINQLRTESPEAKLKKAKLTICSKNTFPTAAGCASSASSMACLVTVLSKAFSVDYSKEQLSSLARLGSGSACRSLHGGFVEWVKFVEEKNDSFGVQIADENHWPELKLLLVILSCEKKDTASTIGMERTKQTSEFLKFRVENVVPQRLHEMKKAIIEKDSHRLFELTMKESNSLHAVCRDTFPTINYLTEGSNLIIKAIHELNTFLKRNCCAYSFDAGSNAFILVEEKNLKMVKSYLEFLFLNQDVKIIDAQENVLKFAEEMSQKIKNSSANVKDIIEFQIGTGASIIK